METVKDLAEKAGINGASDKPARKPTGKFDPNFTKNVIAAMGPKTSPRMRQVMGSLIQHIHDFARENEITVDEWMAGVELVSCLAMAPSMVLRRWMRI